MKLLPIAYVFVMALAALALPKAAFSQTIHYNASKSNTGNFVINPANPKFTEQACTAQGGQVSIDAKTGQKICLAKSMDSHSPAPPN